MQWTARVFHHLVRLPLAWFDARSKGSINARFEAVDIIQQALTTQVLEGILDMCQRQDYWPFGDADDFLDCFIMPARMLAVHFGVDGTLR